MGNQEVIIPLEIKQKDERTLSVHWQDGHGSEYPCDYLRKLCHCAACVDEWTGEKRLVENQIQKDVHPIQIQGVGRYGIKIDWSDGHNTGIYTFKYLREICPCRECKG
ncbi:MAG: DUF971 domain-containing protein [Candidatus Omnitrophica bacterium]|nr:DUF971 domain-containing protein [Candidatus Omnitrophota bacterium]